jgi:inosose dehydratase
MKIRLGNGPDSWGVWFPQDPDQVRWDRFLTDVAHAGYRWIELGPYGYLRTDVAQLKDELAMRDLRPVATFIEAPLEDPERAAEIEERVNQLGEWLATLGGRFLNVIDDAYRDLRTGRAVAPAVLSAASWRRLVDTLDRLGRLVRDRHGIALTVHPHVDTSTPRKPTRNGPGATWKPATIEHWVEREWWGNAAIERTCFSG